MLKTFSFLGWDFQFVNSSYCLVDLWIFVLQISNEWFSSGAHFLCHRFGWDWSRRCTCWLCWSSSHGTREGRVVSRWCLNSEKIFYFELFPIFCPFSSVSCIIGTSSLLMPKFSYLSRRKVYQKMLIVHGGIGLSWLQHTVFVSLFYLKSWFSVFVHLVSILFCLATYLVLMENYNAYGFRDYSILMYYSFIYLFFIYILSGDLKL